MCRVSYVKKVLGFFSCVSSVDYNDGLLYRIEYLDFFYVPVGIWTGDEIELLEVLKVVGWSMDDDFGMGFILNVVVLE